MLAMMAVFSLSTMQTGPAEARILCSPNRHFLSVKSNFFFCNFKKFPFLMTSAVSIRDFGCEIFYLRDFPFHHSQKEILTAEDYSDFELWLRPTNELYTPLLSRGCNIQVLEPEWLVEEIKGQIETMRARYE